MLVLDHLAIAAETLEEGVAWTEERLGVALEPGGKHDHFGTHNALLGLADGLYLEVIAIDPDAPKPDWPRWFGLDQFTGPPRLANWICKTGDMHAALAASPAETGLPVKLQRDNLHWQLTVPDDGSLPFGGAAPTLIEWPDGVHPSGSLRQSGCALSSLVVTCDVPDLPSRIPLSDRRVSFAQGPCALQAVIATPDGPRRL